jgi:hypothetical protein
MVDFNRLILCIKTEFNAGCALKREMKKSSSLSRCLLAVDELANQFLLLL